jgi:hypothetical protein
MNATDNVIDEMTTFTQRVRDGLEDVKPGMPASFTTACVAGDTIWQGDLGIVISDSESAPEGFVPVSEFESDKNIKFKGQLVPGSNTGSRHCLQEGSTAEVYLPSNWNEESFTGPFLKTKSDTVISHPVHGDVTIPGGFCIQLIYQREWDKEQQAERRARD